MKRHYWVVTTLLVGIGGLMFGLARAPAQRGEGGFGLPPREPVGRYQVVRANEIQVVLLDTATGDLYQATPRDFKPYSERPRTDGRRGFPDREPGAKEVEKGKFERDFDKGKFEKGFEKTETPPKFDKGRFEKKEFIEKKEAFDKDD